MSARNRHRRPSPEGLSLIRAAQIVKSHHTDGAVIIRLASGGLDEYDYREPVFLYFEGLPVPFFIEEYRPRGNSGALVKFKSVNDLPHAEELLRMEIFIDPRAVNPRARAGLLEKAESAFPVGCTVLNREGEPVGTVSGLLEYPGNPCLQVLRQTDDGRQTECLIPFHPELVLAADPGKKLLQMHIPEGLLHL